MFKEKAGLFQAYKKRASGFTLIELMIVVAIIAIILTLALPVYSNYTIRAKVGEALSISATAKTSVSDTCQADTSITGLTPDKAGVALQATKYVSQIDVSGPCTAPVITITTQGTGAVPNPVLKLTGDIASASGRMDWKCSTDGLKIYVPKECRSS